MRYKLFGIAAVALALTACAGTPKQDELAAKGRLLDGKAVSQELLAAKGFSGRSTITNNPFTIALKPDGTYAGTANTNSQFNFTGKWRVSDDGKLCLLNDPPAKPANEVCPQHYKLDGEPDALYAVYKSGTVSKYQILR